MVDTQELFTGNDIGKILDDDIKYVERRLAKLREMKALVQRNRELTVDVTLERSRVDELLRQRERSALDMDAVSAKLKIAEEMRDTLRRKLATVIEAYGAVHDFAAARGLDTADGDHPSKSDVDAAGDALAEIDELVDVG